MRTNDGRINHLQRGVGHAASGERFQHHVPDAAVGPPAKLPKNRVPVAKFLRKVAPRRARSHHPKHGVEHAAMVPWRPPAMMDQERFETRPLIVGHQSANHGRSPQRAALNQLAIPPSMALSTRPSHALASNTTVKPIHGAALRTLPKGYLYSFNSRFSQTFINRSSFFIPCISAICDRSLSSCPTLALRRRGDFPSARSCFTQALVNDRRPA